MTEQSIEVLFKKHDVLSTRMTKAETDVAVLADRVRNTNEKIEGISHQLSVFTGEVKDSQFQANKKLDKILEQYHQQRGGQKVIGWVCATLVSVVAAGTGVIALLRG